MTTGAPNKKTRGFTMVELLVTVAIIGIISSLAPRVLVEMQRFFLMNRTRIALQRDARAALTLMTRNLRQAQASTVVIDRAPNQPFYSRIRFRKMNSSVDITYYQLGRRLMMQVGNRTSKVCDNVRFVAFALPATDELNIVSLSMTLEQRIFEGRMKALHLASEKVRVMNA